ncbi:MAG: hypothetical protein OXN17_05235 [Candidatus Poribacteria bacterium]|nr:hypothetical protein [Candidatus Poribacteria bacterium]
MREERDVPLNGKSAMFEAKANRTLFEHFRKHGHVVLKHALTPGEVRHFVQLYDNDREKFGPPNCWHPFDVHQTRNCHALVTSPGFDKLLRHP